MSGTDKSVRNPEHPEGDCKGLTDVLSSVGDKWTIMVIGALAHGTLRYNEIERRVNGISQRMLTLTLKRLETDGLLRRTLFPSVPARVEYDLTALGLSLRGALEPLHHWALTHREEIALNRQAISGRRSGHEVG